MTRCKVCGAENLPNTLFCEECGGPLTTSGEAVLRLTSLTEGWEMEISMGDEVIIGRFDPESGFKPHLDLGDYKGVEKGVSRRHARIFCKDGKCYVEDLGSTNGTFINNRRLNPFVPEPLRNGDELRLGGEVLKITL